MITPYQRYNFSCAIDNPCDLLQGNPDTNYNLPDLCQFVTAGFTNLYFNQDQNVFQNKDNINNITSLTSDSGGLNGLKWYSIPSQVNTIQYVEQLQNNDIGIKYKQTITGFFRGRYSEYIQFFEKLTDFNTNYLLKTNDSQYIYNQGLSFMDLKYTNGPSNKDINAFVFTIEYETIRPAQYLSTSAIAQQILN